MVVLAFHARANSDWMEDGVADKIGDALRVAMMHSTAAMVLSDPLLPDCPMVAMNPAFTRVTGYSFEEAVGRNCRFLQGAQTDPDAAPRIRASLEAGQGCIEWIINYRKDGRAFWNLLFISPVHDESGALRYFFGHQLDITVGMPDWFVDVSFGRAHVEPKLEAEFHAVLGEIGDADRTQALDRIVAAAHRLAEITVQLTPGTLSGAWAMRD
jgi:PAS domain S-box-containing protein